MIAEKRVRELAEERLATFNGFIVELSVGPNNIIKLLIDSDASVSISDCMSVSRNVEHNLDREEEDFSLEVSSAGLDQPFKVLRQYIKNVGRDVSVVDLKGNKLEGQLKRADENSFTVVTKRKEKIEGRSKAKHWVEYDHNFDYKEVKETKVIISFK
jgi:ribosome maturation factor RimP